MHHAAEHRSASGGRREAITWSLQTFFVHNIDPVLVGVGPPIDCDARIHKEISPETLFGNWTKGDLPDFCISLARKEEADKLRKTLGREPTSDEIGDGGLDSTRQPKQLFADVQIDKISVALVQLQVIIGVPFTRALKDNSGLQGIAKRLQAYYTKDVSA